MARVGGDKAIQAHHGAADAAQETGSGGVYETVVIAVLSHVVDPDLVAHTYWVGHGPHDPGVERTLGAQADKGPSVYCPAERLAVTAEAQADIHSGGGESLHLCLAPLGIGVVAPSFLSGTIPPMPECFGQEDVEIRRLGVFVDAGAVIVDGVHAGAGGADRKILLVGLPDDAFRIPVDQIVGL